MEVRYNSGDSSVTIYMIAGAARQLLAELDEIRDFNIDHFSSNRPMLSQLRKALGSGLSPRYIQVRASTGIKVGPPVKVKNDGTIDVNLPVPRGASTYYYIDYL